MPTKNLMKSILQNLRSS